MAGEGGVILVCGEETKPHPRTPGREREVFPHPVNLRYDLRRQEGGSVPKVCDWKRVRRITEWIRNFEHWNMILSSKVFGRWGWVCGEVGRRLMRSVALRRVGAVICVGGILAVGPGCSRYATVGERPLSALTVTGAQGELLNRLEKVPDPLDRLGILLDEANGKRLELAENPSHTLTQADYNFAVARIMEIIGQQNLAPWDDDVSCKSPGGEPWSLGLVSPDPRPEYHPSKFRIMPSDRFDFRGKLVGERTLKEGLGAPTVVVGSDSDFVKIDQFAQGKQIFYGLTAVARFEGKRCEIIMVDPLEQEKVMLDGRSYPVAADFQAPLALMLAELNPRRKELSGLFKPDRSSARLFRLQPYSPRKIPVLCIHGLGDSPATWMPLIDHLRGQAMVRKHYQFWFFGYPTGRPYQLNAAVLRQQLDRISEKYPDHKDLVVIGHSMGGMISRLLITDSGTKLWDTYFAMSPDEIPLDERTRTLLRRTLIFEARPNIARVIYASASHRGAYLATNPLGRIGSRLIGAPISDSRFDAALVNHMRPEVRAMGIRRLPNSIEGLDPDNLFLKVIDTLPPKPGIPFHSIIGDRGRGGNLDKTRPESSDGIVPYWSSHLDGAETETIVPSHHWSIRHPRGMEEVERILIHHLVRN